MSSILPSGNPEEWGLGTINTLIHNVATLALLLAGGVAAIYLIIGGISYLTAYGNEEKANNAKKTITWAVIGLAVIILAEVIVSAIWSFVAAPGSPSPIF